MQSILAHRLQLVRVLVVTGLRAVVIVSLPRRPPALHPLGLASRRMGLGPLVRHRSIHSSGHGMCAVGGEGFGGALLRHGGSIERVRAARGDDVRAQRAGGGGVDEAGVARVLDAMHDGRLAVVAVGLGGFPLQAAVGARMAAGDDDSGRLRSGGDGASGGC